MANHSKEGRHRKRAQRATDEQPAPFSPTPPAAGIFGALEQDNPSAKGRVPNDRQRTLTLRTFLNSLSSRPRGLHILLFVMFLVLGFAVTTTVRTQAADPLSGLNEDQLVALLADLDQTERSLRDERTNLQNQLADLKEASDAQEAAKEAVAQATEQAQIAAGTVPVEGPGAVMRVSSPTAPIPVSVFTTTLAELRNAGAESISINDVRLNARSWFASEPDGTVVADGVPLTSPYVWRAIGESNTLAVALEIRGGAVAQFRAYGATVTTEARDHLEITAVAPDFVPQWARPAVD